MPKLFGTDGIRGTANVTPMTPEETALLGLAVGRWLEGRNVPGPVIVGRDTRLSGPMLEAALLSGLAAAGRDVVTIGVAPTPAISLLVRTRGGSAGAVISASHNPFGDNGIKLFGPDGGKLTEEQEDEIEANSMQALYTVEKLKQDPKFKAIFSRMRSSSTYADQRLKLAQRFNKYPDDFSESVRQLYYYGLPSFDAASSQILSAVSAELERRQGLDTAALAEIENSGVELQDAMGMTVQELTGSVGEIRTADLKKIQDDLLHKAVYTGHYESASGWPADMLGAMRTSRAPGAGTVPAL